MLPAARNKAKVDLIRPLSEAAQHVLALTPKLASCDYVFSTDGKHAISGFSGFKRDFDKAVLAELKKATLWRGMAARGLPQTRRRI